MEKRNYNKKAITKLIVNDKEVTDPKEILTNLRDFYEKLYSKSKPEINIDGSDTFFDTRFIPTLDYEQCNLCEGEITKDELFETLKKAPENKTPGCDGICPEFYLKFWENINEALLASINYAYNATSLSVTQRRAVITLLPKQEKDTMFIKNWRPVSLLNTDYKLASRCIANRLAKVLPTIIHEDQSAFIKGRRITENIRLISDIIEWSEETGDQGALLFLDYAKAFDSIEWPFLFKALQLFNFGPSLIKWVRTFYSNIQSCIINRGNSTGWFDLQRGVRQGCPLSTALFCNFN